MRNLLSSEYVHAQPHPLPLPHPHTTRAQQVPGTGRAVRDLLFSEYVHAASTQGRQPPAGEKGQVHAVWTHRVRDKDVQQIKSGACVGSRG